MTKGDREALIRHLRRREAVAKTDAQRVASERLADVEQQLASIYQEDDEHWRTVTAEARRAVAAADAELARRCRELGIPEQFRPSLHLAWEGRGENWNKERRAELRRVAQTRIEAMRQEALATIARQSVAAEGAILTHGLESEAGRAILERLPTVEQLVPALDVGTIQLTPSKEQSIAARILNPSPYYGLRGGADE
jgi:hypothetical protein